MSPPPGSGRKFSPLAAQSAAATLAVAMDGQLNILLVEDHLDTAFVTERLLRRDGHVVRRAETLAAARQLCGEQHFDLMVTNLQLPDGDTWELLVDGEPCRQIPAIMYSAHGSEQHIARGLAAGFRAYLVKPVTPNALRDAIRRAVIKN